MDSYVDLLPISTDYPGPSKQKMARVSCCRCNATRGVHVFMKSGADKAKAEAADFFKTKGWGTTGPKSLPACPDCLKKAAQK